MGMNHRQLDLFDAVDAETETETETRRLRRPRPSWWGNAAPGPWCGECDCAPAAKCPEPAGGRWECACGNPACSVRPHYESERKFLQPVHGQKGRWAKWPLGEIWTGRTAGEARPEGDKWRFVPCD